MLETEKFVFPVFPEFSSSIYTKFRESECCSDHSYCEAIEKYNSFREFKNFRQINFDGTELWIYENSVKSTFDWRILR